jgi:DNA (cytosine-5)-methyltransferase 1
MIVTPDTHPVDRPVALDLFCGAGGATKGLQRAGFFVVGVDIKSQPRYCGEVFIQDDAMTFTIDSVAPDFVWASPPCQSYSIAMRHLATPKPRLIDPVRERLEASGAIWVIENVPGAPLRNPLVLCGTAFGMRVHRHRLFESAVPLLPPDGIQCNRSVRVLNPHRAESRERIYREFGRQDPEKLWRDEMGVPWMGRHETREAIPPAYSEYIGKQIIALL